jgi:hypothetical protein
LKHESYRTQLYAVDSLSQKLQHEMAALYLEYYDGASEKIVLHDLKEKTKALLLWHDEKLVGFTTFEVYGRVWQGESIVIVYSGDTIVDKAHWGQQALAYAWIGAIGELKQEHAGKAIYWFLIVKGHRTYKYLPAFTHRFYPHWEHDVSELKPLLDALAAEKFADAYDPKSGLIRFRDSRGHLKARYALPNKQEYANDAVRFFLDTNPRYGEGEELACLCSFEERNLRALTKRVLRSRSG